MPRFIPFCVAITIAAVAAASAARAQTPAAVHVQALSGGMPLEGARIRAQSASALTDSAGLATLRMAPGAAVLNITKLGFVPDTVAMTLASGADTTIAVEMFPAGASLSGIVVTSTRTERRLEDEPLRIEVLAGDDVSEKNEMRPGDLRNLFREMSGVRVQATSASLGAAAVRVQGLRGRYTMVLNDGLPLYGTHAGGFGLVQQAPLDLRQVEVIKGAASAIYGPSALGGVVNLISRRPPDTSQVLVNKTASGGSDLVGFAANRVSRDLQVTALAGAHYQSDVDPDRDLWSDVTGVRRLELRPRLFYGDSAGRRLMVTVGAFGERRGGGIFGPSADPALRDSLATRHGDAGAVGSWPLGGRWSLGARLAVNEQSRTRVFAGSRETERQRTGFGEVTASRTAEQSTLLLGASWQGERYHNLDVAGFDEAVSTPGVFVQHTLAPAAWISATVNGRCDVSSVYGTICTPRVSLLAKPAKVLSLRASAGAGWFAPSVLNEETEVIGLKRVSLPAPLEAERGRSASVDATLTVPFVQISGTVFQNRVRRPTQLRSVPGDTTGAVQLVNAPGSTRITGAEVFGVFNREPLIATVYYAATRGRERSPETALPRETPLTPREEAGLDFALEDDESGAYVAIEVFYTGRQALADDPYLSVSLPYTTVGLLGSKRVNRATVFLNLDNLTGVRQSRYEPILRPGVGPGGTRTVSQWAPLEGRTVNAGVRYAF